MGIFSRYLTKARIIAAVFDPILGNPQEFVIKDVQVGDALFMYTLCAELDCTAGWTMMSSSDASIKVWYRIAQETGPVSVMYRPHLFDVHMVTGHYVRLS